MDPLLTEVAKASLDAWTEKSSGVGYVIVHSGSDGAFGAANAVGALPTVTAQMHEMAAIPDSNPEYVRDFINTILSILELYRVNMRALAERCAAEWFGCRTCPLQCVIAQRSTAELSFIRR
ncbi:hypothetical protein [Nocardia sp. NPDC051463]|uniref:hypothetical protein n=1 Tax=Nocardia sp. NPDC051463 TaxID=3154845 RepID=UPI00343EC51F